MIQLQNPFFKPFSRTTSCAHCHRSGFLEYRLSDGDWHGLLVSLSHKGGKEANLGRERSYVVMHCHRGLNQSHRELASGTGPLEKSQTEARS